MQWGSISMHFDVPIVDNSRFVSLFVYFIHDLKVTFSN